MHAKLRLIQCRLNCTCQYKMFRSIIFLWDTDNLHSKSVSQQKIYRLHYVNASNALRALTQVITQTNVFNDCLKVYSFRDGSRTQSGSEFQAVRPATENARQPNLVRPCPWHDELMATYRSEPLATGSYNSTL